MVPNNSCQHMKVMTGHRGSKMCVCVCVCACEYALLRKMPALELHPFTQVRGSCGVNVTIAGRNDLCRAGRHHSLNPPPPPPCLFQFSPSFTVKGEVWLFSLSLSSFLSAPHIVKQASHWSRNVLKLFELCNVLNTIEENQVCAGQVFQR